MKTHIWLLLTLLLALSLAACGTPAPVATEVPPPTQAPATQNVQLTSTENALTTESPVATEAPVASAEAQPYPGQGTEAQAQPEVSSAPPYPAPGEPEAVDWSKAEETILSGNVIQIHQARSLQVTLTLNDGRTMVTTEPAFDEVVRVKERCAEKCNHILLSSESQQ